MKFRRRLLKFDTDLRESRIWNKLSNINPEEKAIDLINGISKYYLEQKPEPAKIFKSIKFNNLVEIIEYPLYKPQKITKISELNTIAHDLKKNCGMIENLLKPSTNRYRIPEKILENQEKSVATHMNVSRKNAHTPSLISISKSQQPIKLKSLTRALTFAKKLNTHKILERRINFIYN
ncbi:hypothetical protein SteCoe_17822 [Stentor coeruleus]|uniref:Uncharacterized protein n=1 Tax=Stentor coeruleus TaxID=5963 RepID=A0A1R2BXX8_9CILI|nr:hypothetical protein SteCoe_17822 [Stentor coeruleus]